MGERRGTKGLELWCRKMTEGYPGVKIDNMTTSWRDGLAFCAMIHHFRPDLIDFEKLNKDDVYHNNELAFRIAEHHLGIPALLEPEDMVEYTVPDRLSILTYLSQFYQAFAVPQGSSSARIGVKRPQTSPDHGIVSPTSTSPPSKVAFKGAGKIRREPCAKCSLPVFIAERLNVGKLLYHRTCFRCARCNSQLTLANYYETENGEFCCEICPDEEKIATKASPESSVLLRSMSDEEKTASLKTFTNEPDDYSAMFETALESIKDDGLKTDFTVNKNESPGFTKARSSFFQSQLEYSNDSGNEDKPPDLPKSEPPKLHKNELTVTLKDSTVDNSALSDSGFPNNRLDSTVNIDSKNSLSNQFDNSSVALDKTHNIVTKDKSETEGDTSLVKARMRLFEANKSVDITEFRKSDVRKNTQNTEKVPLASIKSPTHHRDIKSNPNTIVKSDKMETIQQLNEKELQNSKNFIDKNKISINKAIVPLNRNNLNLDDDSISNKYIGEKDQVETQKVEDKTVDVITLPNMEHETKIQDIVEKELESQSPSVKEDDLKSSTTNDTVPANVINEEDSAITILDSSQETEKSAITIEDSPVTESRQENNISFTSTVEASDVKYQTADMIPSDSISKSEYKSTYIKAPLDDKSPSDNDFKSDSIIEQDEEPEDENYPDELNPFDDEDEAEEKGEQQPANTSLNPFEDEDDDEENAIIRKPVPSPRMRKKVLPVDSDKQISETPEDLSRGRVSVNPFESDDEGTSNTEPKPPMPATRKKKIIAAPKISLNPFWSEDEENEDNNVRQPVPKPRVSRTSLGVPEPKPREAGGLSLATRINFGSNSSISSGSAYGSVRKKKLAPRPPISAFKTENYESAASSLTSSPSHSVQHSPKLTPKYRKSKRAPAPPSSSTPVPPHRQTESVDPLSSTALSPIKLNTTELILNNNEHKDTQPLEADIEQEKIVKDEMNRNRQSQNVSLQSPSSSENSSSLSAPNKSTYGKWKRRKGQAPTRPIPQRRTIKCLPMAELRRELEVIEIQQQGLEKQGVRLEQIIREKCEGSNVDSANTVTDDNLPIDVEDLILQLFELVNEKNELFRKQAELMYLRRQQRLEEEHADVEYQIRCLMLQPEANKTDSDKAREEELINRLVEIVERRNEIIECLEMDRVREAEEDDSINNHINLYTLKRDGEKVEPEKIQKEKDKDKKKHKKEKKLKYKSKGHKVDADKDIDETEVCSTLEKKKKKKFNIF